MRNWIYILILLIGVSCQENEIIFKGPYHVRFTETSDLKKESYSPVIEISVHLVAPQIDEDIVINYSISGDARKDIDYEILGTEGQVIINQGASFGYIRMRLINNANNILESQDVILTLENVSPSNYEIGFGDGVKAGETYNFTIEDDCILGGSYTGVNDPSDPSIQDIQVFSQDCITYTLSNWDVNVFNFVETRSLQFTDNGDNTLTIPEQEEVTLPSDLATIRGDGFVDPVSGEMTMNIELVDFENSPIVTITFMPQ